MELNFEKNIRIKGTIVCETGLHISRAMESIDIGGVDAFVIRDMRTGRPYIPGSSLKGKIRSLLELEYGQYPTSGSRKGLSCNCGECDICLIFGHTNKEKETGPTRIIVRDTEPTEAVGEEVVEIKGENTINRITSEASPRFFERVPAGSKFNFEMIYSVYHKGDLDRLKMLFEGMSHLEDNYLGGSGSRGYGKIRFEDLEFKQKTKQDYQEGNDWKVVEGAKELKTPSAILSWLKGQGSKQD
ncbi:MAG: type III-A CRISPR-associated RAMP protein Csm3 [Euryarchaeota archaeon]|nr:type III-A CRISPR-associated RAMP protein Csm3 [Euryarchaeota archaeon]